MVCGCKYLEARDKSLSPDHVYREQKSVVDGLANLSRGYPNDCKFFVSATPSILLCFEADLLGFSNPTAVLI